MKKNKWTFILIGFFFLSLLLWFFSTKYSVNDNEPIQQQEVSPDTLKVSDSTAIFSVG